MNRCAETKPPKPRRGNPPVLASMKCRRQKKEEEECWKDYKSFTPVLSINYNSKPWPNSEKKFCEQLEA
ncbi:hypothetical protein NDU88_004747 [Pleurodeles waltl]|uniref:Uncharacterized protein n=1 Tax=Pleurodeles waltl TaxID=8319 RepID=A0AAV7W8C6_PLEWA|nr:hypothetical protein NDU88_004747 [Pleurodeles waltl]